MRDTFIERLSQPRPDPGGGAAAAHGGLLALAIMEKIAQLETARPEQANRVGLRHELVDRIRILAKEFQALQERDCAAYMKLAQARTTGSQGRELAAAWEEAILCPIAIVEASVAALKTLSQLGEFCARHLVADLQVASEFVSASFRGACHIARSNVHLLTRDGLEDRYSEKLSSLAIHAEDQLSLVKGELQVRSSKRNFSSLDR